MSNPYVEVKNFICFWLIFLYISDKLNFIIIHKINIILIQSLFNNCEMKHTQISAKVTIPLISSSFYFVLSIIVFLNVSLFQTTINLVFIKNAISIEFIHIWINWKSLWYIHIFFKFWFNWQFNLIHLI
jgi:hypothetical protein